MKRTTIFVPEMLERDLQLFARRQGKSAASVVREAVADYISRMRPVGRLPAFAGAFDSGRSDTAERHEELLFDTLTPHDEGPTRRARPRARRPGTARRGVRGGTRAGVARPRGR